MGACGKGTVEEKQRRVAIVDLGRWGDSRGFSPLAAPSVLGSLQTCAVSPRECTWVCGMVTMGSSSLTGWESLGKTFNLCEMEITQGTSLIQGPRNK